MIPSDAIDAARISLMVEKAAVALGIRRPAYPNEPPRFAVSMSSALHARYVCGLQSQLARMLGGDLPSVGMIIGLPILVNTSLDGEAFEFVKVKIRGLDWARRRSRL